MRPVFALLALSTLVSTGIAVPELASALTMQECSTKYQAAKSSGTLGNQTWNQFRAASCGDSATAAPAPVAAPRPAQPAPIAVPSTSRPAPAASPPPVAPPPVVARPVAPTPAVVPPTDGQTAEVLRERQCGAEWRANKATLEPQYWSACNTRIKTTGR